MSFTIFYNENTPFQVIETRSSKSRKIDIFSKGLTFGFDPKMTIFPNFSFLAILARKMSFMIFQNEKTSLQNIKTRISKSRKMAIFPSFFFQTIQARKISFTIYQNENTPFQAIKTRSSRSRKIDFFPKGLPLVLLQKWPFFQVFFFR